MRNLFVSPVGGCEKKYLKKIIKKFGHKDFDYLIFVYDNTRLNKEIFNDCKVIYKKGLKWQLIKNNIDPKLYEKYDYVFAWDDDIDIKKFSYKNFIEIMKRNELEIAQPALTKDSYFSHKITVNSRKYKFGRFTDYVEIMVPVYKVSTWLKLIKMIKKEYNGWGWGYDSLAKSFCGCKRMGIIDCESVKHTRPLNSFNTIAPRDLSRLYREYKQYKISKFITYGALK